MMAKALPRGIRNNNPGNIERGKDRWLGSSADQSGDPRFIVFDTAEAGIRALMRLLINYQERHSVKTLRDAINRWAPPVENDSSAYVQHVARLTNLDPDEPIDFLDEYITTSVARAIIRHENGAPESYGKSDWYDEATFSRAAVMAGFDPKPKPLAKSRTVIGGAIAAVGAVAGAVAVPSGPLPVTPEDINTAVGIIAPLLPAHIMAVVSPLTTLIGIGLTIYARWDDSRRKIR